MKYSPQTSSAVFAVAVFGIATYAAMDVVMKGLSLALGAYNAMLWRSMIALLVAGVLYLHSRPRWPRPEVLRLHAWRGAIIAVMAFLFFWGLKYLPVAEAIGLSLSRPLVALYLAAVILHEQISRQAAVASLIGLTGAVIIVAGRLGGGDYDENTGKGIAAVLCSAVMYAYNLILQRRQALVAGPMEIAFFHNCTVIGLFACLAPFLAVAPPLHLLPGLAGAGVLGVVSLMMMSWAYARAPANRLIPVEYTAFIWAAILGWLAFGETLSLTTVAGTVLIVAGCFIAAWQRHTPAKPMETPAR